MITTRWFSSVVAAGLCLALVACGGGSSSSPAPQQSATPAPADGGRTDSSAASDSGELDINTIFPAGPGRDLVLNNCLSCHTIVPLVVLQMDRDQWMTSSRNHRERVDSLTDDEFNALYEYLIVNFNPDHPVPKLPRDLLDTWTAY